MWGGPPGPKQTFGAVDKGLCQRSVRRAILCHGRSKWLFKGRLVVREAGRRDPPPDLARNKLVAIEICLAEGKPEARAPCRPPPPRGTIWIAGRDSLAGTRAAGKD